MLKTSIINPREVHQNHSASLFSKQHEDLAHMVQFQLRQHFGRETIWAIPEEYEENKRPCLSIGVVDTSIPDNGSFNAVAKKAQQVIPGIYGDEDVRVSYRSTSIGEEDRSFSDLVGHILSLYYGHKDYVVYLEPTDDPSNVVLYMDDLTTLDLVEDPETDLKAPEGHEDYEDPTSDEFINKTQVPNDVILHALNICKQLRPDIQFMLSSEVQPVEFPPYFAPGYFVAP